MDLAADLGLRDPEAFFLLVREVVPEVFEVIERGTEPVHGEDVVVGKEVDLALLILGPGLDLLPDVIVVLVQQRASGHEELGVDVG